MTTEPKVTQDGSEVHGMTEHDYAYWLADKIHALGDYAKEAAQVLQRQADALQRSRTQATEAAVIGTYCSVMKGDKATCDLHNLHCAYPSCCESVAPPVATEHGEAE